jgi:hypothetical protein
MVQLWTVTQKGRRSTSSGARGCKQRSLLRQNASRLQGPCLSRLVDWAMAAAKQVYQPSCPRALTSVPRIAVNGCLYAALSSSSRRMQSGANDARQLVNKMTETSQTIRGGSGVCGEDGMKVKTTIQCRHPAWRAK